MTNWYIVYETSYFYTMCTGMKKRRILSSRVIFWVCVFEVLHLTFCVCVYTVYIHILECITTLFCE